MLPKKQLYFIFLLIVLLGCDLHKRKWVWRLLFETGVTDGNFWNGLGKAISYSGMFPLFIYIKCDELSLTYFSFWSVGMIQWTNISLVCVHTHIHVHTHTFSERTEPNVLMAYYINISNVYILRIGIQAYPILLCLADTAFF